MGRLPRSRAWNNASNTSLHYSRHRTLFDIILAESSRLLEIFSVQYPCPDNVNAMFRVRVGFNEDPAFKVNADADPDRDSGF
jgi:hypothetical protein